jgi:fumarylacetoacetase
MPTLNETHDPKRRSWAEDANRPGAEFPIQNLPFGIARRRGSGEAPRGAVAIGDRALDLAALAAAGLVEGPAAEALAAAAGPTLNRFMGMGPAAWSSLRTELSRLLAAGGEGEAERRRRIEPMLLPLSELEMLLPAQIGDYTDFYASVFHATNVGRIFRPDNPLLPNYKWVPIGYHGRASSVVPSGTEVRRPTGQVKGPSDETPRFCPSRLLDYELEVGFFVGPGNALGETVPIDDAGERIFGFCLVNDWSARDIQAWEYQPLGPFLAKSFATTISPWIVTAEALAPFRTRAFARPAGDPAPLPYLVSPRDAEEGGIDIELEVSLLSARMRREGLAPHRLSRGNFRDLYWTVAQLLAHHASNGCNLRPGDLVASGTVSGAAKESWGSLMELTQRGKEPIALPTGETRGFIEDGDEVLLTARCVRDGFVSIGFGECRGVVQPAAG